MKLKNRRERIKQHIAAVNSMSTSCKMHAAVQ